MSENENEDGKHLDLLSLFHYVVGGMGLLFSFLPSMHVWMGYKIATDPEFFTRGRPQTGQQFAPFPAQFGWLFMMAGGFFILLGLSTAVATLIAAGRLKRRTHRLYCMIVAGVLCMFMPFGTVLGVFTLIVLQRDSVKKLFDGTPAS